MINDKDYVGSRFLVGTFVACRVGISSGEGDTLKETRENENRKDAIRTFRRHI